MQRVKFDSFFNNTSGSTTLRYGFPLLDMSQYDRADFYLVAPNLSATATAGGQGLIDAAVYAGTAATATSLTLVSSATALFGTPTSAAMVVNKAAKLFVHFAATLATGTTFSIAGQKLTVQSSHSIANLKVKTAGATAATSLMAIINGSTIFNGKYAASTDIPVGATDLSSLVCMIWSKDETTYAPSATGKAGATASEGVLLSAEYNAHIGVPAEKLGGKRFITIAAKSSAAKVPVFCSVIRSAGRYTPPKQGTLAVDVNLGSTTT